MARNSKRGRRADLDDEPGGNEAQELIQTLANGGADTSRLLELYYWTREPGIVELIRAYLDMPERTQRSLSTFLLNGRPGLISSAFDQQGRLVLGRVSAEQPAGPAATPRRIPGN
ncbi:MAG TPA: hypothetical protein VNR39_12670 [Pseudolabrys sp.]|nr:hypothetical protein [Pseudolabrys sp.]